MLARRMSLLSPQDELRSLRWTTLFLSAAAIVTLLPFWAPLALAAWLAILARPVFLWMTSHFGGGRGRAAGAILVVLGMGLLVPIGLAVVSLIRGAIDLGQRLARSQGAKDALVGLVGGGGNGAGSGTGYVIPTSAEQIVNLIREHGAQALGIASNIAGAAASAVIAIVIFFYAAYVFLVDGPEIYDWIERHAPFNEHVTGRFAAAFEETGRGLIIGSGLTALIQAVISTITYVAVGVPRSLVLGFLTFIAAILPAGTPLIWVPVCAGLFFAGRRKEAIIVAAISVVIVGTIDNVLRPVLSRRGSLQLSTFVLLLSMLGGFAIFGGWGLVLGPLSVRLCKEAMILIREARIRTSIPPAPPRSLGTPTATIVTPEPISPG